MNHLLDLQRGIRREHHQDHEHSDDHDAIGKALRPGLLATARDHRRWTAGLLAIAALGLQACGGGGSGGDAPGEQADGDGSGAPSRATLTLTATGTSAHTASLAWTAVPGAQGYTLERRADAGGWVAVATPGPNDRQHLDDGLTQGTAYTYRVAAIGVQAVSAEQAASTTDDTPVATALAAPTNEAATSATLGAEGGSLATADGRMRFELPAGATASRLNVSLQPSSNPAPDGLGDGVRLRLDAAPAKAFTLSLAYDESEDRLADGMGVALQRVDGSWLSLPLTGVDKIARRLSVQVSPALAATSRGSDAAAGTGREMATAATDVSLEFTVVRYLDLRLSPRSSTIEPGASQLLVPRARTLVQTGYLCHEDVDIGCLAAPLLETRDIPLANQKDGYQRQWSVFAEVGGNAVLGTVTPRASTGADYRAPSQAPEPNPVWVAFQSRHRKTGRTLTLGASVQVAEPHWTMILGGQLDQSADIGFRYTAEAVWTAEPGQVGTFRANGTQTLHVVDIVCSATPSPATVPLPPGALVIDRSVQPARYRLDVGSVWDSVLTGRCPEGPVVNVPVRVPGQLVVEGTLSADGQRIEGATSQNHVEWNWALTRGL